jgi:hypothetical protein
MLMSDFLSLVAEAAGEDRRFSNGSLSVRRAGMQQAGPTAVFRSDNPTSRGWPAVRVHGIQVGDLLPDEAVRETLRHDGPVLLVLS